MIKAIINGKQVSVEQGTTILDAAKKSICKNTNTLQTS